MYAYSAGESEMTSRQHVDLQCHDLLPLPPNVQTLPIINLFIKHQHSTVQLRLPKKDGEKSHMNPPPPEHDTPNFSPIGGNFHCVSSVWYELYGEIFPKLGEAEQKSTHRTSM